MNRKLFFLCILLFILVINNTEIEYMTAESRAPDTVLSETENTNENEYMDSLFENIQKYQFSEEEPASGIVQCIDECPGTCLADGYTGSAWCFE